MKHNGVNYDKSSHELMYKKEDGYDAYYSTRSDEASPQRPKLKEKVNLSCE